MDVIKTATNVTALQSLSDAEITTLREGIEGEKLNIAMIKKHIGIIAEATLVKYKKGETSTLSNPDLVGKAKPMRMQPDKNIGEYQIFKDLTILQ